MELQTIHHHTMRRDKISIPFPFPEVKFGGFRSLPKGIISTTLETKSNMQIKFIHHNIYYVTTLRILKKIYNPKIVCPPHVPPQFLCFENIPKGLLHQTPFDSGQKGASKKSTNPPYHFCSLANSIWRPHCLSTWRFYSATILNSHDRPAPHELV